MLPLNTDNKGVSSTVSTILLVGIVVALVVLTTFIVFNFTDGGDSSENIPRASVDLTQTSTGVTATVLRNENIDRFIVRAPTGTEFVISDPGETVEVPAGAGFYSVIAVFPDGSETVIATQSLSSADLSGFFTVVQDEQNEEAYAELEKEFSGVDDYEIVIDTNDSDDGGSTTSYDIESDDGRLLSSGNQNGILLSPFNVEVGDKLDTKAKGVLNVAPVSVTPNASQFGVDEQVALHKMTNLCKGDEVHLVDSSGEVLETGDEIRFNSDGCDDLRRVAQYEGNEIVGVELINLWHQNLDYSVFQFNGDVPPPSRAAPDGDSVGVSVQVLEEGTTNPIEDASVSLGDISGQTTNADGYANFTVGSEDITLFATAKKQGFYSSSVPVDIPDQAEASLTQNQIERTVELELPPEEQQQVTVADSPDSIGSLGSGDSITVNFGNESAGAAVSGGSGLPQSGSSSGTIDTSSQIYSGESSGSTTTLSGSTTLDTSSSTNNDALVDIIQPDRQFNTISVDEDTIPTGSEGEFLIQTSVLATNTSADEVEDQVIVKAYDSQGNEQNLVGIDGSSQNQTVFLEPGKTEVVDQKFHFPQDAAEETYSIYVTLGSVSELQSAGELETFKGTIANATISGADVSPQNPVLNDSGQASVDVTVSYDAMNISGAGGNDVTLDIFENGQRVDQIKNFSSGETHTYTRVHDSSGYYDYHVGIQQSQSVALADSVLVQPQGSADVNFNVNLNANGINGADCTDETGFGSQFDCEILVNDSLEFSGSVGVSGADASEFSNVDVVWTYAEVPEGQEAAYREQDVSDSNKIDWSQNLTDTYNASDYSGFTSFSTNNVDLAPITNKYDTSEAYIVELRIRGEDQNGNRIGAQDSITVNVAQDPNKTTTQIVSAQPVNNDTISVELESQRETFEEQVRVDYVGPNGTSQKNRTVSVPRSGSTVEIIDDLVISNYEDPNATVGEDVIVDIAISDADGEFPGLANANDTAQATFQVIPEIIVDAEIEPIACGSAGDADTILVSLDKLGDYSRFDEGSDIKTRFSDSSNVTVIDTSYWDGDTSNDNSNLDVSQIESNTSSCVVAN